MKYVIKLNYGFPSKGFYYLGSKYLYQGVKIAGEAYKDGAKRYSTYAQAEHMMNELLRTCVNASNAEIEEVED